MVELLLTLLVLYGLQCVVLLPRGATLFLRPGETWRASAGPGWRMLHPWPSADGWLASRPPLQDRDGELRTVGRTRWLGAGVSGDPGVAIVPGGGQKVELRGSGVRVDRRPALWGPTKRQAGAAAELLRSLAADGADAARLLDAWRTASFAADELARTRETVADATRWLGLLSDLALLALLAVLPALATWLGGERALIFFAPAYLALHLALLVLLGRAHGTLRPDEGDRFEVLLSAALYPPLLLRGAAELKRQALVGFHPAAVAAEVLPREEALDFLRGELGRATDAPERAAILSVVTRLDSSEEALFAPPERSDPLARSYCPGCRTEYRLGEGECVDCGAVLRPLGAEVPSAL